MCHMSLPGLVKIRWIVLEISRQNRLLWPISALVTLTFDLLASCHQNDRFMPLQSLATWTACASGHENRFTHFKNIVFAGLLADKRTKGRTDGQVENIMPPPASLPWRRHN